MSFLNSAVGGKATGAAAPVGSHCDSCASSNPTSPFVETLDESLRGAAGDLGLKVHVLHASTERDFDMPLQS